MYGTEYLRKRYQGKGSQRQKQHQEWLNNQDIKLIQAENSIARQLPIHNSVNVLTPQQNTFSSRNPFPKSTLATINEPVNQSSFMNNSYMLQSNYQLTPDQDGMAKSNKTPIVPRRYPSQMNENRVTQQQNEYRITQRMQSGQSQPRQLQLTHSTPQLPPSKHLAILQGRMSDGAAEIIPIEEEEQFRQRESTQKFINNGNEDSQNYRIKFIRSKLFNEPLEQNSRQKLSKHNSHQDLNSTTNTMSVYDHEKAEQNKFLSKELQNVKGDVMRDTLAKHAHIFMNKDEIPNTEYNSYRYNYNQSYANQDAHENQHKQTLSGSLSHDNISKLQQFEKKTTERTMLAKLLDNNTNSISQRVINREIANGNYQTPQKKARRLGDYDPNTHRLDYIKKQQNQQTPYQFQSSTKLENMEVRSDLESTPKHKHKSISRNSYFKQSKVDVTSRTRDYEGGYKQSEQGLPDINYGMEGRSNHFVNRKYTDPSGDNPYLTMSSQILNKQNLRQNAEEYRSQLLYQQVPLKLEKEQMIIKSFNNPVIKKPFMYRYLSPLDINDEKLKLSQRQFANRNPNLSFENLDKKVYRPYQLPEIEEPVNDPKELFDVTVEKQHEKKLELERLKSIKKPEVKKPNNIPQTNKVLEKRGEVVFEKTNLHYIHGRVGPNNTINQWVSKYRKVQEQLKQMNNISSIQEETESQLKRDDSINYSRQNSNVNNGKDPLQLLDSEEAGKSDAKEMQAQVTDESKQDQTLEKDKGQNKDQSKDEKSQIKVEDQKQEIEKKQIDEQSKKKSLDQKDKKKSIEVDNKNRKKSIDLKDKKKSIEVDAKDKKQYIDADAK